MSSIYAELKKNLGHQVRVDTHVGHAYEGDLREVDADSVVVVKVHEVGKGPDIPDHYVVPLAEIATVERRCCPKS